MFGKVTISQEEYDRLKNIENENEVLRIIVDELKDKTENGKIIKDEFPKVGFNT